MIVTIMSACSESDTQASEKKQTFKRGKVELEKLYGTIIPEKYVTGMFNPAKSDLFVEMNSIGIKTNGRKHYFRKEAALNLKKMFEAFKNDNPNLSLWVVSSTRNFYAQKYIWEAKWNGKRKVDGLNLAKSVKDPVERGLKILQYSSMPGTSRHHWGTDVDINNLNNPYFKKGSGKIIFDWLKKHGSEYGFYQVYTPDRKEGYNEESWHWSYLPLAICFYNDWLKFYSENNKFMLKYGNYEGAAELSGYAYTYVTAINTECKEYGTKR